VWGARAKGRGRLGRAGESDDGARRACIEGDVVALATSEGDRFSFAANLRNRSVKAPAPSTPENSDAPAAITRDPPLK
jgi:hypothetical protein